MGFALSDMQLTSTAFGPGEAIQRKHSGEGDDVSPGLNWQGAPDEARSFVMICHDPDAPLVANRTYGFTHWLLYNIPGTVNELPEGTRDHTSGQNNFDKRVYGGPMPPNGHGRHHYFFWLLALDNEPELPAGLDLPALLDRIEPNVIAMNRLVGTYKRD